MGKPTNLRVTAGLAIFLLVGCATSGGPVRDANVQSTPLHKAALSGDVATIRSLLADGADVNARAEDGSTPLHLAAVSSDDAAAIRALLADGADVNARTEDGSTPLHAAAAWDDAAAIRALLAGGANVNARAENGSTPLHAAALWGDAAAAIRASISAASTSPKAALSGDAAAVRALLADGANVNARTENGSTPLHFAAMKKMLLAMLAADAKGGRDKLLKEFSKAILDTLDETNREMFVAILKDADDDRAGTVRTLLAGGAAVNARTDHKGTPLHFAALSGDAAAIEALLDAGGDPNAVTFGCGPMDMARFRMKNTETSIAPFRDSIEALRAAGARPRKGCRF